MTALGNDLPNKHLEHNGRKIIVDRLVTLGTASIPVEYQLVVLLRHCTLDRKWAYAVSIIVHKVCEHTWLIRELGLDQFTHSCLVSE